MAMNRASLLLSRLLRLRNAASPLPSPQSLLQPSHSPFSSQHLLQQASFPSQVPSHPLSPVFQLEQKQPGTGSMIALQQARRLLRLVNVEAMKKKLKSNGRECMSYVDLLHLCQTMGVASSNQEAGEVARALDDAGVVLIFRDKVYLNPQQVAEMVVNAVPLALSSQNDPRHEELQRLQMEKEQIDTIALRQTRKILWSGLGYLTLQTTLLFRLTFWELSWDVMEPIAFFVTTTGLLAGYTFFLVTSKDPTYQDLMQKLFVSKQKKLIKRRNFNMERLSELQKKCPANWKPTYSSTNSQHAAVIDSRYVLSKTSGHRILEQEKLENYAAFGVPKT